MRTTLFQEGAGNALCDLLEARSSPAAAVAAEDEAGAAGAATALEQQLLQEMLLRAPDAQWARSRLARLQLVAGQYEAAVAAYQAAIRWEEYALLPVYATVCCWYVLHYLVEKGWLWCIHSRMQSLQVSF